MTKMLLALYDDPKVFKLEEKFLVNSIDSNTFVGKYPLESFFPGARGVYGGELVSQGIIAAWETIEDTDFSPHSFHAYFIRAGMPDVPVRWEVDFNNDGRNYKNRLVRGFQDSVLKFELSISFTRDNSIQLRKLDYSDKLVEYANDSKKMKKLAVPFEFQLEAYPLFKKYREKVHDMDYFEHANGNLQHIVLPEYFEAGVLDATKQKHKAPGDREFGVFVRINDDLNLALDKHRARIIGLAFLLDSFYLRSLAMAVGYHMEPEYLDYFKVSLDHAVWIHDSDFDPTEWMFMDFKFPRLLNNRVLCQCRLFTLNGNMVASIVQEGLVFMPKRLADGSIGGTYKL